MNDAPVNLVAEGTLRPEGIRPFRSESLWRPAEPQYALIRDLAPQFHEIELEVGAGQGWHAIQRAQEHPDHLILGVERTRSKFQQFQRRHHAHRLANLVSIHSDVIPWLVHLESDLKFKKIWLLYPNPEAQAPNRRWIRMSFFELLVRRLTANGEIHFATNLQNYADEILKMAPLWGLSASHLEIHGAPRTHFEKKYQERGDRCQQITLRRRTHDV